MTHWLPGRTSGQQQGHQDQTILGTLCVSLWVCLFCAAASAEDTSETRAALEKWVEIQRVISQEKRDLALAKEMLRERIQLVEREIENLRDKIAEAEASIAEANRKRDEIDRDNDALQQTIGSLLDTLVSLEVQTRRLVPRLPEPLRERVKPLSQRLPDASGETVLSVSERFQNVIGLLNEVNKFNQSITTVREIRALPDGTSAEVTAVYLGLGQASYSGANGRIAGVGVPSDQGWVWKPADHAAGAIAQVVAILNNEHVAAFVQVPVTLE